MQLGRETVLHEGLAAAQREATRHDPEGVAVLSELLRRFRHRDRDTVADGPGVGVVAVAAAPHAAGGPGHDPHPGAVDGRAGGEGVQEPHVAGCGAPRERSAPARRRRDAPAARTGSWPRGRRAGSQPSVAPWKVRLMTSICCSRREPYEVHRVARDADRQARVLLRVVHGVEQRVAVQDVDVHVVAGGAEEGVEDPGEVA